MKCVIIALLAVLAVASAGLAPLAYSTHYAAPLAYSTPYSYPYAYNVAPVVAPAVSVASSGYVAATRGSLHVAPLPEGPFASSQHINTAPAPGTF
nr:uncharacterized protein LOC111422692 [Onthophagus taurus]